MIKIMIKNYDKKISNEGLYEQRSLREAMQHYFIQRNKII